MLGNDFLYSTINLLTQTERQRTQQPYHRPEKSGSDTIKGEGDTQLESDAVGIGSTVIQLYSYTVIIYRSENNASKVNARK